MQLEEESFFSVTILPSQSRLICSILVIQYTLPQIRFGSVQWFKALSKYKCSQSITGTIFIFVLGTPQPVIMRKTITINTVDDG